MVEIVKRRVRVNGFACPLHPTQLLTYVIYFGDILSFYAIDMVSLYHNSVLVYVLGSIYLLLTVIVFYYGLQATKRDPTDPTIALEKRCKEQKVPFNSEDYEFHCQICDSHVLSGSKHCGQCNRCTSGFDHHCRYLNNCIGEQNYDYFFKLIVWTFWMCLMHNLTNVFVILDIINQEKELLQQHMLIYSKDMSFQF